MVNVQCLGEVSYKEAWALQQQLVCEMDEGKINNQLLLLRHPHTITLGRGTNKQNLLLDLKAYRERGIEVVEIDRGGDVTYHGPGQLVGYPLIFIAKMDPHKYLRLLEEVIIETLAYYGLKGERKEKYTGVWIGNTKIAAIGIKFNRARFRSGFITSHGFALNVNSDLSYFETIIPCGIQDFDVTSLEKVLGKSIQMELVERNLIETFKHKFC